MPIDNVIAGLRAPDEPRRTERYGKKYGWIGFYTYAGILADRGQLPSDETRLSDVDIDPSFPDQPPPAPITPPVWVCPTPAEDQQLDFAAAECLRTQWNCSTTWRSWLLIRPVDRSSW